MTKDARGVETAITYGSVGGYGGLYPTQVETASNYSALKRTATTTYDFHTGLALTSTDADNGLTSKTEYDALGRPTKAITAYGDATWESWTTTEYHDADRFVVVRSDLETKGDGRKVAAQYYDQLGRVRLSRTLEDAAAQNPDDPCLTTSTPCAGVKVQTRYKTATGYAYQLTSNPYRASTSSGASGEDTMGWTRSKAWASGHESQVETFSGTSLPAPWGSSTSSTGLVDTVTDANATTVTDQAGKLRRSVTNALGQLTRVDEPDNSSSTGSLGTVASPNQATSYTYDTLNNLTTVTQGVQTRTFAYSSLSRLLTAANPESGTISYVYDANSNLTKKTDARGVVTDYVYDALNRITNRNYSTPSGTPANYQASSNVTYTYGTTAPEVGKLTKVESSVSTTEYTAFDILGRVTGHKQTIDGNDYTTAYAYNLGGALIEETYPSGRKVQNTLDASGDLEIVKSRKNASSGYWAYANNFTYNAAGAVTSMQLGNGTWESTAFNSRLQLTQIALGVTQGATGLLKLDYTYGTTVNNGNVQTQTIMVPTVGTNTGFTATQTYTYDSLNRLNDAKEMIASTETWKQTFVYDRYGNRTFDTIANRTTTIPTGCPAAVCNPSVNTSDNKLKSSDGYVFDNAGNTTTDAENRTFNYDGENKQVEVRNSSNATIGQYFYDGDGKRVKKYVPSTGEVTVFVYDASGKTIAEYSTIVTSANDAKVAYLNNDHLGSPRINTDKNGNVVARHDYHPFGDEITTSQRITGLSYADDTIKKQFTGYERDNETELDFAQARYFNSGFGRFSSADPLMASARKNNPQTFNRYAYVLNRPLALVDSSGLCDAPAGLQKGQVGFCFEAFIKSKGVGPGGLGHGDNRTFDGGDPSKSARVTVWGIAETNEQQVGARKVGEKIERSTVGGDTINTSPLGSASTNVEMVRNESKVGEKDFGAEGIDVKLTIANGMNGVQQTGVNIDIAGQVQSGTASTAEGKVLGVLTSGAGKLVGAALPGTIDGNMTVRVTNDGQQVTYVGGEVRGYPSYALYAYTRGQDGSIQRQTVREVSEGTIDELTKPMKKVP